MQEASANRVLISNSQEEIFNQEIKERVPEYIVVLHAPSYSKKPFFCSTFEKQQHLLSDVQCCLGFFLTVLLTLAFVLFRRNSKHFTN